MIAEIVCKTRCNVLEICDRNSMRVQSETNLGLKYVSMTRKVLIQNGISIGISGPLRATPTDFFPVSTVDPQGCMGRLPQFPLCRHIALGSASGRVSNI